MRTAHFHSSCVCLPGCWHTSWWSLHVVKFFEHPKVLISTLGSLLSESCLNIQPQGSGWIFIGSYREISFTSCWSQRLQWPFCTIKLATMAFWWGPDYSTWSSTSSENLGRRMKEKLSHNQGQNQGLSIEAQEMTRDVSQGRITPDIKGVN